MSPNQFDWEKAFRARSVVRIKTEQGNTIIGRIKSYVIIRNSGGSFISTTNNVIVKGIVSHSPGLLKRYSCCPLDVISI